MDINPSSPPDASAPDLTGPGLSVPDAPAPDWLGHGPIGRAERRLAGLEHLAGVGIRLADAFAETAFTAANTAWIEPDCHVDPGIPFAGMVRVVRQTYALQQKFEKDARSAATADAARRDPDRRARHVKRRRLIKDAVTEAIKDTADPSDAERLLRDLEERLHDEEADERFDDGPVGKVVAKICKALGVSIDLSLYEDADVQPGPSNPAAHQPAERANSPQPPVRPPASRPDASRPDVSRPDTFWPDASRPDASRPDASRPDASRPGASQPDVSRPDAPGRDTPKPPASRRPDAHTQAGPRISGTIRGEPSPLEKYLGPPPPPQIPRWRR